MLFFIQTEETILIRQDKNEKFGIFGENIPRLI